jgi:PhzF family phenazine biosynthesis protein
MDRPRYLQVDVFPARPGGGNPLGVVVGAQAWTSSAMQAFAAWTGLVETTFVLPPDAPAASYRLRIFTPRSEIPFAGHPTVGSAHAVLETGFASPQSGCLVQQCGAGPLPVRIEGEGRARILSVRSPPARVLRTDIGEPRLRGILDGCTLGVLPPALVEGGRRWWIAEFASEAALRAWRPHHEAIGELARSTGALGLCVFARSDEPGHELAVRAFPAGAGIIEDPASGAANGLIAAWIHHCEPDGPLARGYRVSQGREMGHDALINVRIESDGTAWVGGRSATIVSGHVDWAQD